MRGSGGRVALTGSNRPDRRADGPGRFNVLDLPRTSLTETEPLSVTYAANTSEATMFLHEEHVNNTHVASGGIQIGRVWFLFQSMDCVQVIMCCIFAFTFDNLCQNCVKYCDKIQCSDLGS